MYGLCLSKLFKYIFTQIVFVLYMILVTLLLVNMLIAMMGNTYQLVNETQKEWLRQVMLYTPLTHSVMDSSVPKQIHGGPQF